MSELGVLVAVALTAVAAFLVGLLVSRRQGGRDESAPVAAGSEHLPSVETLVAILSSAVVLVDGSDTVLLANSTAVASGMVSGTLVDVPVLRQMAGDARRGGQALESELDLAWPSTGHDAVVRARAVPVDPPGCVVLLVEDVTEPRRVEAVRRDFVANVSHELKTPVGAMAVLAETLITASEDPEAVRRFADRIHHESTRLSRLVQELIDLSRLQASDPGDDLVPVDRVVDEAIDRHRLQADNRNLELVRTPPSDVKVRGSEAQLVTALGNLIDNAINYSPTHTRVTVAVRADARVAEIAVIDRGVGIGAGDLDRIFERFYRADPARSRATGGTGLGLSIVKNVANNHRGSVRVWSQAGVGSTFTLTLPLAHDEGPAA